MFNDLTYQWMSYYIALIFTIDFSDHTGLVKDAWYKQIEDLLEFAKKEEHIFNLFIPSIFN
jgi:hypothetical protein